MFNNFTQGHTAARGGAGAGTQGNRKTQAQLQFSCSAADGRLFVCVEVLKNTHHGKGNCQGVKAEISPKDSKCIEVL